MKILKKLNPKNYSISTQILLIFAGSFVFVVLSLSFFYNKSIKTNKIHIINQTNELFEEFKQKDDISYLSLLDFYQKASYPILIKEDSIITNTNGITKVKINGVYYYTTSIIKQNINDTINYELVNDFIIIGSGSNTGVLEDIIYPNNLNHLFINTKYYNSYINNENTYYYLTYTKDNIEVIIINPNYDYSNQTNDFLQMMSILYSLIFVLFFILTFLFNYLYAIPIKDMMSVLDELKHLDNTKLLKRRYKTKEYQDLSQTLIDLTLSLNDIVDSLNQKNYEITKYNEELSKEYQFKKQLVATISHEIKTPLTAVQAIICAVLDEVFTKDEAIRELNVALNEIEDTNNMLQQIVQLYQLEGTDFKLDLRLVDLSTIVIESIKHLSSIANKYNQRIEFDQSTSYDVYVDESLMARVINNIILNAIIYSPSDSLISIKIKPFTSYYILEVINYGTNIPNDEISKVFNAFYRVDKSRSKSDDHGNGLGLYLVSETLKKHNLDFGIENIKNAVRFYIKFLIPEE